MSARWYVNIEEAAQVYHILKKKDRITSQLFVFLIIFLNAYISDFLATVFFQKGEHDSVWETPLKGTEAILWISVGDWYIWTTFKMGLLRSEPLCLWHMDSLGVCTWSHTSFI